MYEIISHDEYKRRKDGGFYVLYWSKNGRYYGGMTADYSNRRHRSGLHKDTWLSSHWKKHGPPDLVIVVPLKEGRRAFEQSWLDLFSRNGPLYTKKCMNMGGSAGNPGVFLTPERRHKFAMMGYNASWGKLSPEERRSQCSAAGKRGGKSGTPEQRKERATRAWSTCKAKGVGLPSITPEQRMENYKKGFGKMTTKQRSDLAKRNFRVLDRNQVHSVRRLLSIGDMTHKEIAEYFPCTVHTIDDISKGNTYKEW